MMTLLIVFLFEAGSFAYPQDELILLLDSAISRISNGTSRCSFKSNFSGTTYGISVSIKSLPSEHGQVPVNIFEFLQNRKTFNSADEAAVYFAEFVRSKFSQQNIEYCANIAADPDYPKKVTILSISQGTPERCITEEYQKNILGMVHSHPGTEKELSLPSQVPSINDFARAASDSGLHYLVGPAGQVLKYSKNEINCRGSSLIKYNFEVIQNPRSNSTGTYEFDRGYHNLRGLEKKYQNIMCRKN
jgi:hypothetical protein